MRDKAITSVHWSFWLIGVVTLLWNAGGAMNYIMQMDLEFVATLPETHRAIIIERPLWATGGFAVGVFGGVIGCLLLLARKTYSLYMFIVSLIGIFVTIVHTINVAATKIEFSSGEIFIMILSPVMMAVFLIGYTKHGIHKGWVK